MEYYEAIVVEIKLREKCRIQIRVGGSRFPGISEQFSQSLIEIIVIVVIIVPHGIGELVCAAERVNGVIYLQNDIAAGIILIEIFQEKQLILEIFPVMRRKIEGIGIFGSILPKCGIEGAVAVGRLQIVGLEFHHDG